jgi:hypothetical protein
LVADHQSPGETIRKRPKQIVWAVVLLCISVVIPEVYNFGMLKAWRDWPPNLFVIINMVGMLMMLALVYCMWRGFNWARWFFAGSFVIGIAFIAARFSVIPPTIRERGFWGLVDFTGPIPTLANLLQIGGLCLAFFGPGRLWFSKMKIVS